MFVFAADDVTKKDLKKISKKIEKQVAKWEEKDQEREKRKRESETDAGVSDERVEKKPKVENESVKNTEIRNSVEGKHYDWLEDERISESSTKRQNPLRDLDDKSEREKVSKITEVPDTSLLEECEVIVDVNEAGVCDFAVISDKSVEEVSNRIFQSDGDNISLLKNTKGQLSHISVDNGDFEDGSRCGLTEEPCEIVEECDLIVEVNEKGSCSFTVLSDNPNTDIKADDTVLDDSSSSSQSNSFYLCKCGENVGFSVTGSACDKCINKSLEQNSTSTSQDCQSESGQAELKYDDAKFEKYIETNVTSTDSACPQATCNINYLKENADHSKSSSESNSSNVGHVQCTEIHNVSVNLNAAERTVGLHEGVTSCDTNCSLDSPQSKRTVRLTEEQTRESEETNQTDLSDEDKCKIIPRTIPPESDIVALDCEFVGVGLDNQSALGRCSIVDFHGKVLCDIYARPEERITDYRTRWSGITRNHMKKSIPIHSALSQIAGIIRNKVVVGHAIHNDFLVLGIPHSRSRIRDTAKYRPLMKRLNTPVANQSVSLKRLALQLLGRVIQTRQHCSVEDSRAAMDVYKLVRDEWENRYVQGDPVEDEIIKPSVNAEWNRKKRQLKKLKRQERLKRTKSTIEMTNLGSQNESQSSSFHRSVSDLNLSSGQITNASNEYLQSTGDNDRYSNHGNRSWSEGQNRHVTFDDGNDSGYYGNDMYGYAGYLGDEYWEDVTDSDLNSFGDM